MNRHKLDAKVLLPDTETVYDTLIPDFVGGLQIRQEFLSLSDKFQETSPRMMILFMTFEMIS
jgi:hypothetical protein